MSNLNRVFTSASPWVVGREALVEDAVDDFLHETTRQKPWLRARYEAQLGDLNAYLDRVLGGPAPLTALSRTHADTWLRGVADRTLAERALTEFTDYLVKWGWLSSHPLSRPPSRPETPAREPGFSPALPPAVPLPPRRPLEVAVAV